jgi:hypothetical protein
MILDGPHPTWPIYKYQPINGHTLGNLAQGKLWASPPSAFNDPFECRLQRADQSDSLSHLRAQNPNLASQSDKELIQMAIARYEQEFTKFGIICFSQHPDNILMWSHYTDHHRGICLGFADSQATPIERGVIRSNIPMITPNSDLTGYGMAMVSPVFYMQNTQAGNTSANCEP